MCQLADARAEARRLLDEHGPAALLQLSDAMSAAMRRGDHNAAEHLERIMVEAEHEIDGKPLPPGRLGLWRRAGAATSALWQTS